MLRAILRSACALIPDGTPVPVLRGPFAGGRFLAGAAAGKGKGLSPCLNLCEPEGLALASELGRGAAIVFDIGANVGLYSCVFARVAGRVFAFEPVPRNICWLRRTLAANHLRNVEIVPSAVADRSGLRRWSDGDCCATGALSENGADIVSTTTIDEFCQVLGASPDVIKIDAEGAEIEILTGGRRTLSSCHPRLLVSIHDRLPECRALLGVLGYRDIRPIVSDCEYEILAR